MVSVSRILDQLKSNPTNVRYNDLYKVCVAFFGEPRRTGGSHAVFATPWPGDPRVNIQNSKGRAKTYQVKQVLAAIERLGDK
ncbi:MAG: toxin HicA [Corynebacterium sp.]|nr:toxin HicA [Corynebacterium sp.]MDO5669670.1 toxin HicA [Corynebacterium sp.]